MSIIFIKKNKFYTIHNKTAENPIRTVDPSATELIFETINEKCYALNINFIQKLCYFCVFACLENSSFINFSIKYLNHMTNFVIRFFRSYKLVSEFFIFGRPFHFPFTTKFIDSLHALIVLWPHISHNK